MRIEDNPKFRKLVNITAINTTEFTGIAYLWVDDEFYLPAKVTEPMPDDINHWESLNTKLGEEEFENAPLILDMLKDLHYKLTHISIINIKGKRKVRAYCESLDNEKIKVLKNLCEFDVIELHFFAQVPTYIHESLLIDCTAPLDKQLPDFTLFDLEEMVQNKQEQLEEEAMCASEEDDEYNENDYTTSLSKNGDEDDERRVKRIKREWDRFEKHKKHMKVAELEVLENDLLSIQEYEKAGAVFNCKQEKQKVTKN